MNRRFLFVLLAVTFTISGTAHAAIIESGNLNIISDAGNPSDGLAYLDISLSEGLSAAAALAAAQAVYAGARFATPAEFDDLFDAAGVTYVGALRPSDAFLSGGSGVPLEQLITAGGVSDPGVVLLRSALGPGSHPNIHLWTDPDGIFDSSSTRDAVRLADFEWASIRQLSILPPNQFASWLIVTSVPEPTTGLLFGVGALALLARVRSQGRP